MSESSTLDLMNESQLYWTDKTQTCTDTWYNISIRQSGQKLRLSYSSQERKHGYYRLTLLVLVLLPLPRGYYYHYYSTIITIKNCTH